MKKKLLNIVLALTVVVAGFTGFANTARADEIGVNWEVDYDGSKINSTFADKYGDSTKDQVSAAMPGDTLYYEVEYKNATTKPATFYVNANVAKTLEDGIKGTGGAYSYVITNNGSEIFSSKTVGGDNPDVVGLEQVKQGEDTYFSLGSVAAGESGKIRVEIKLDGNTQNNSYMDATAELNVVFCAEPTSEAEDGGKKVIPVKKSVVKHIVKVLDNGTEIVIIDDDDVPLNGGNPRTGDSILPIMVCAFALLVGIMLILWYFKMTNDQRREEA